jgi:hypothetical protein
MPAVPHKFADGRSHDRRSPPLSGSSLHWGDRSIRLVGQGFIPCRPVVAAAAGQQECDAGYYGVTALALRPVAALPANLALALRHCDYVGRKTL